MKHIAVIFAIVFLGNGLFAQTKRALIFAIGDYPAQSGWPKISSVTDITYVKSALDSQQFKDIKIVPNAEADSAGIANELNKLIQRSNQGDIVVIHFSSHGELIEDDQGKLNGLEPCIVTYQAKYPDVLPVSALTFKSLAAGYFREDHLENYLHRLRAKLGSKGDVILFMDLCHAGVGTRGANKVRGGKPALVTVNFTKKQSDQNSNEFNFRPDSKDEENKLAHFEGIGAARVDEFDYEVENNDHILMGPLSFAISEVFASRGDLKNLTYRSFFSRIKVIMNAKSGTQHPVLFGNEPDRVLFGGQFITHKSFVELSKISGTSVTIGAGVLSGFAEGATINIYPAGTQDTTKVLPLASGVIVSTNAYTATASLDRPLPFSQAASGWALITKPVYKFAPLNIQIIQNTKSRPGYSPLEMAAMKEALENFVQVSSDTGHSDLQIIKGRVWDTIKKTSDGSCFDTIKHLSTDTARLVQAIKRYRQYDFLKSIELTDPKIDCEVKLIRVHHKKPDTAAAKSAIPDYIFKVGDTIMLWVNNKGPRAVFLNVLDMQPNGIINPLLPINNGDIVISPEELMIKPGTAQPISYPIEITPPAGTEVFKIFLSSKMIDMTAIANTRGEGTKSTFAPLEQLVEGVYNIGTRANKSAVKLSNSEGSTYNLLFEIRK